MYLLVCYIKSYHTPAVTGLIANEQGHSDVVELLYSMWFRLSSCYLSPFSLRLRLQHSLGTCPVHGLRPVSLASGM